MPMFADAINFPIVLTLGLLVLAPLIAFETFTEAFVLSRLWKCPARQLWIFAFIANCLSLAAGIPAKIINSYLYDWLLPNDLPSYFAAYPSAIALGSLIYFLITIIVEALYALRSRYTQSLSVTKAKIWTAVLLANIGTYAVLAPLHYYFTRPIPPSVQFTADPHWSASLKTTLLFTDPKSHYLYAANIDGSDRRVIVPFAVRDYLVSSNLNFCLYRGSDNNLHFHRLKSETNILVWQTTERFRMDQVAFSPSGRSVAYASDDENSVVVLNLETNQRYHQTIAGKTNDFSWPSIAWSISETNLYLKAQNSSPVLTITIAAENLQIHPATTTNDLNLVAAFGRVSSGSFWGGYGDWGQSFGHDECDDVEAWCESGLGSGLRIFSRTNRQPAITLDLRVNPGLIHLAAFHFNDVAFLGNCNEALFDTKGYIYFADIKSQRLATITAGERFTLVTPRYLKRL
jgi:hypothetical protein